MRRPIHLLTLALTLIVPLACGGPPGIKKTGKAVKGEISGVVMKGLVAGATVTAYTFTGLARGKAVGVATTDTSGSFTVDVGTAEGTLLLEAVAGNYTDEATGKTVPLGDHALDAIVPHFKLGTSVKGIQVNPVTTFITAYTGWRMGAPLGEPFDTAFAAATAKLGHHFGGADWASVFPRDLTQPAGAAVSLTDPDVAEGLFLAGLSQEATDISTELQVSDTSINAAALVDALATDIGADGVFDGHGRNGSQISLYASSGGPSAAHYDLDGDTLRAELSRSMVAFLASTRNAAGLGRSDADALLKQVASDGPPPGSNPKPGEFIFATPGKGDIDPPVVSIVMPQENDGVRGDTPVTVTAVDAKSDIATIAFTTSSRVSQLTVTPTGKHAEEADGVLKAGTLPDGPFTLHAYAIDTSGNRADAIRHVEVANHAPTITITSPTEGATVAGTLHIQATAAPNPTSQAALDTFQVVAPAGLTDGLPVTGQLDDAWDTTTAPEGPFTVKLEAVDSYGSKATAVVHVIVDNRPAPIVSGHVEVAGLPVENPLVTIIALDAPSTAYPGGAPIGHAVGTSAGDFHVTLTDENYFGPVDVVASANLTGGAATTYHDAVATPGGLDVAFGAGDQLVTYLPSVADPAGGNWVGIAVSPWSTVSARLARYYTGRPVTPLGPAAAAARANDMIAGHFSRGSVSGTYDLTHAIFVDPSQTYTGVPAQAYPTLADAGLEQLAADLDAGQIPGTTSVLTLVKTLTADIADGVFDGKGVGGPLPVIQGVALDSYTTRSDFALEIDRFVNSPANGTGLDTLTLKKAGLYGDVSVDNREIYPPSQPGHEYDTTPPTIVWTSPAANNADAGSAAVDVDVSATDPVLDGTGVASFVITAPPSLAGTDLDSTTGRIHVIVDNAIAPNAGDAVAISVKAVDNAGNVSTSTRSFTRPAPTVKIVSVTDAATSVPVSGDVNRPFEITAQGTAGYATKRLVLIPPAQGVNDPSAIGPDTDTSALGLAVKIDPTGGRIGDGLYTFRVEHDTIDGRSATDQVQLTVDTVPPSATTTLTSRHSTTAQGGIFVPRSGVDAQGTAVGTVTFGYTATDDVTGIAKVELVDANSGTVVASAVPSGCNGTPCQGSLTVTEPNGAYRFLVRATDGAGNAAVTPVTSLVVDTVAPSYAAAPALGGPKASDGAGGWWLPKAGIDGSGAYGTATVSFSAQDVPPIAGEPASGVASVTMTVTGNTDTGGKLPSPVLVGKACGGAASCSGSLATNLRDGDYSVAISLTDVAGNTAAVKTFTVHVDTVPPVVTDQMTDGNKDPYGGAQYWIGIDPNGSGSTGWAGMSATATDNKSGVSSAALVITDTAGTPVVSVPLTPSGGCLSGCSWTTGASLGGGKYFVQVQARDLAGNAVAVGSKYEVWVDTLRPSASRKNHGDTFVDEGDIDFRFDPSTSQARYVPRAGAVYFSDDAAATSAPGPTWEKMAQRLTGTSEQDAADSDTGQNLPLFYISPTDSVGAGSVSTPAARLKVDYESEYDDGSGWKVDVPWTPAPPSTLYSGENFVVASIDMLGTHMEKDGALHRIAFRVKDLAGNVSQTTFAFTLHILPVPVAVVQDSTFTTLGNADPFSLYHYGWKDVTSGTPTTDCLAGYCNTTISTSTNPATTGPRLRVTHTTIYQPFSQPTYISVNLPSSQGVEIARHQEQQPFAHTLSPRYWCTRSVSVDASPGTCTIEAPVNAPCEATWGDPSHGSVWQDQTTSGNFQCTPSSLTTVLAVQNATTTYADGSPDVILLDHATNVVQTPVSQTAVAFVYKLPKGTYDLYLRAPVPNWTAGGTSSTWPSSLGTFATSDQLYGTSERKLLRYPALLPAESYYAVQQIPGPSGTTTACTTSAAGQCYGYASELDEIVHFERSLTWYAANASSATDVAGSYFQMNVLACSSATCSNELDPWVDATSASTLGCPAGGPCAEVYPFHFTTDAKSGDASIQ